MRGRRPFNSSTISAMACSSATRRSETSPKNRLKSAVGRRGTFESARRRQTVLFSSPRWTETFSDCRENGIPTRRERRIFAKGTFANFSLWRKARMRALPRTRICPDKRLSARIGIYGFGGISIRPACAFYATMNPAKTNPENPITPILTKRGWRARMKRPRPRAAVSTP